MNTQTRTGLYIQMLTTHYSHTKPTLVDFCQRSLTICSILLSMASPVSVWTTNASLFSKWQSSRSNPGNTWPSSGSSGEGAGHMEMDAKPDRVQRKSFLKRLKHQWKRTQNLLLFRLNIQFNSARQNIPFKHKKKKKVNHLVHDIVMHFQVLVP